MAIIKSETTRELETIQKLEHEVERRRKRERFHHFLEAGIGLRAIAAFIGGHQCGVHFGKCIGKKCHHKI